MSAPDEEEQYLLDEGYLPTPTADDLREARLAPPSKKAPRWLLTAIDEHVEVQLAFDEVDDAGALDEVDALLAQLL
jgi:hypothetical protein